MHVTLLGIMIDDRESEKLNAPPAINRVPFLMVYLFDIELFASIKQSPIYSTSFSQLDSFWYIPVASKAPPAMRKTLLGILMEFINYLVMSILILIKYV